LYRAQVFARFVGEYKGWEIHGAVLPVIELLSKPAQCDLFVGGDVDDGQRQKDGDFLHCFVELFQRVFGAPYGFDGGDGFVYIVHGGQNGARV